MIKQTSKNHCDTCPLSDELYVVSREHALSSIRRHPHPPPTVYLLNIGDDVIKFNGYLIFLRYINKTKRKPLLLSKNYILSTILLT